MTQQPYPTYQPPQQPAPQTQPYMPLQQPGQPYAPQYPQQPAPGGYQQPYPAQQYPSQYPQQPAPGGYQQPYPAQQYPSQYPQQPQPGPAPVNGSLDDFYNQPSGAFGKSISWDKKPIGFTYAGIVARDVGQGDIQQQTDFTTKQPEFYRDGRAKFVMRVPLIVQPSAEHPEGEASLYIRGQARDELVRAMNEAGITDGKLRAGDGLVISLTDKKASGAGMNPKNIFGIRYTPAAQQGGQIPATPAAPQPVAQQPVQQAAEPVQYQQPAPPPVQQVPAQQAPVQQQSAPQPPASLSDEQQALLARLQANAAGQQQAG